MLIDELLSSIEWNDTSAHDLVEVIVERNSSSAWDSRSESRSSLVVKEKLEIREIRRSIHSYNTDETERERKQKVNEEKEKVQSLISKMYELQNTCSYDECMYQVYRHFRRWSAEDSFSRCDYVLKYVSTDDFDIHILISLLMASYPLRSRLSFRNGFYDKVLMKARLSYTAEEIQRIFGGLK